MRRWTILALLVAVCAVFLCVGHTEEIRETSELDDFAKQALNDATNNRENDNEIADSFEEDPANDDDDNDDDEDENDPQAVQVEADSSLVKAENALESVNETPLDDEDEPALFERSPGPRRYHYGGRRRRRRRRRRRDRRRRRRRH